MGTSNKYSSFQFVPEKGGVEISFLKCWSRLKLSGNKVVGYCLEMPNLYSPFQFVPERGGVEIYFLKCWSRKKISGNKVVADFSYKYIVHEFAGVFRGS